MIGLKKGTYIMILKHIVFKFLVMFSLKNNPSPLPRVVSPPSFSSLPDFPIESSRYKLSLVYTGWHASPVSSLELPYQTTVLPSLFDPSPTTSDPTLDDLHLLSLFVTPLVFLDHQTAMVSPPTALCLLLLI